MKYARMAPKKQPEQRRFRQWLFEVIVRRRACHTNIVDCNYGSQKRGIISKAELVEEIIRDHNT